jgi:hypothetical protein
VPRKLSPLIRKAGLECTCQRTVRFMAHGISPPCSAEASQLFTIHMMVNAGYLQRSRLRDPA